MKYTLTFIILLSSIYSIPIFANCGEKEKILFSCNIQKNNKILEVCDKGKTVSYSFGKDNKKPEQTFSTPKEKVLISPSGSKGSSESYSIIIPNGDINYNVYWNVEKSGVIVEIKGKEVASINCIKKTVIHNIVDIDLKPNDKKIDESDRISSEAEVVGQEKEKYDEALQNCFNFYEIMNNTVLASCKEEVSNEFKGTDREYLQAPKLEGLIDIEGSYGQQDDRWDFSLDESSGFHLIHTKKGHKDEIFIADELEFIGGSRYAIYVENLHGKTDLKWALIFNPKTNNYDLEVKTYNKISNKWQSVVFPRN